MSEKLTQSWKNPDLLKWRSDKTIELWGDKEYRDKTIGKMTDPVFVANMREQYYDNSDYKLEASERVKQLWEDPEYATKTREAMKTEEAKNNRSESSKTTWSNPDLINMRSRDSQRRWDDPIERQKLTGAIKESLGRPEVKEKLSNNMMRLWTTPEWRKSHTGENSPVWKGGTSFYPYCDKFNRARKRACSNFFGDRCICCGKHVTENIIGKRGYKQVALSTHHIHHDKDEGCGDRPFNLVPLCHSCHASEGHNEEEYRKYINNTLREGFKWGIWIEQEYREKVMYPE